MFLLNSSATMPYVEDMEGIVVIQARELGEADIGLIRNLLTSNPDWNRTRLFRGTPFVPAFNTS